MPVLGLDIGGANVKAADSGGAARTRPFALWKEPDRLPAALGEMVGAFPTCDRLAVTMTAELCDCFATKREGVAAIIAAVEALGKEFGVWSTVGRLVAADEATRAPMQVASANWHALATFAGRLAPKEPALLIDIGSTTTDIIPLRDGRPVPRGRTDPERLQKDELVYTGVRRTPLCALLPGHAAEFFATAHDAYLVIDWLPEDPNDRGTADGRPATKRAAHARLARMLCADSETVTVKETEKLAERVLLRQVTMLVGSVERVANNLGSPPQTVILAGSGEFLAEVVLKEQTAFPPCRVVSLKQTLGPAVSEAACAHAVAVIAEEQQRKG